MDVKERMGLEVYGPFSTVQVKKNLPQVVAQGPVLHTYDCEYISAKTVTFFNQPPAKLCKNGS
jgi:hypothetical protein